MMRENRSWEVWHSLDLKVIVLMKSFDRHTGEHITRLTNLNRAEPDATLFQVPPGYQIVDETGPFTIEIMGPVHGEPLQHAYPAARQARSQ